VKVCNHKKHNGHLAREEAVKNCDYQKGKAPKKGGGAIKGKKNWVNLGAERKTKVSLGKKHPAVLVGNWKGVDIKKTATTRGSRSSQRRSGKAPGGQERKKGTWLSSAEKKNLGQGHTEKVRIGGGNGNNVSTKKGSGGNF